MGTSSRLSAHFTLAEMTITQRRDVDNTPPPEAIERLRTLAAVLLEPVRERFGRLIVTSGYRSLRLNRNVQGSSPRSAHLDGGAADFLPVDLLDDMSRAEAVAAVCRWVRDSELPFDQVIDECAIADQAEHRWVHLAISPTWRGALPPRREAFKLLRLGDARAQRFPLE
jgi:zinc D-Ala-D-Ala carboxypeptidase